MMNINQTLYPEGGEYIFTSNANGTAAVIDLTIDHHKRNHDKFQK